MRKRRGSQIMDIFNLLSSPSMRLRKATWYGHFVSNVDKQSETRHRNGTADVVTSHGGSANRNVIGCPSANQNYRSPPSCPIWTYIST